MADSTINKKVWDIAGALRDGGVSMSDYLEQLTYLLFLKMIDENQKLPEMFRWKNIELPEECSWSLLKSKSGKELSDHYSDILKKLNDKPGMIGEIYRNAQSKINEPVKLRKVITMIDAISWNSLAEDVKGEIYESLLERIAQDTKSGAGQYFTPRALINTIVKCVQPQLGKVIADPCCGSGGFLLAAKNYLMTLNPSGTQQAFIKHEAFRGNELVPNTYRLCLMNLLLHGIGEFGGVPPIKCQDSLANAPSGNDLCDYVLTNPPFGKTSSMSIDTDGEKSSESYVRDDFIASTSNKQLNFIQHILSMLKVGGCAAVVLPDNVLFEAGAGETIRRHLLRTCDLHTILRLPTGLFYAQGVSANVLFFDKKPTSDAVHTKDVWIYDYRTGVKHTLKQNPLKEADLDDFVKCYCAANKSDRKETYDPTNNPNGRWRKFSYEEIMARPNANLAINWIEDEESKLEDVSLSELLSSMQEQSSKINESVNKLCEILGKIKD